MKDGGCCHRWIAKSFPTAADTPWGLFAGVWKDAIGGPGVKEGAHWSTCAPGAYVKAFKAAYPDTLANNYQDLDLIVKHAPAFVPKVD